MLAAGRGDMALVDKLLAAGADTESTGELDGCTAIQCAAWDGQSVAVKRLLDAGAKISDTLLAGCLQRADEVNDRELLVEVLERCNPTAEQLLKCLHQAVLAERIQIVSLLLTKGADVNGVRNHKTPLMVAAAFGKQVVAEYLLRHGADESIKVDTSSASSWARRCRNYSIETLIKKAAKLRAEAGVGVKPAVPPGPPPKVKSVKPAKGSTLKPIARQAPLSGCGVSAFLDLMSTSQPEWSLYAVEAEFDTVAAVVQKQLNLRERWPGVALVKPVKKFTMVPPLVTVVRLRGSAWTVVFKSLFDYQEPVEPEAQVLSAILQTQVITFSGEDTANAMGYELFANGKSVERADWEESGEVHFHSEHGRKLKQKTGDRSIAEAVFKELGILLPACYPCVQGDGYALAVLAPAPEQFERVELLGWP